MRIISWNIQGIKEAQALQEVCFLKKTYKPHIFFISETLVTKENISAILPKTGFDHFDYVESANHSSGLAVLWDNGIMQAAVLKKEQRAIHMLVHDIIKKYSLIVSGVYALVQPQDKDNFW